MADVGMCGRHGRAQGTNYVKGTLYRNSSVLYVYIICMYIYSSQTHDSRRRFSAGGSDSKQQLAEAFFLIFILIRPFTV